MRSTRIWAIVCSALVVAVLAGGWFIGAQPQLAAADASNQSAAAAETTNQRLQVKLADLAKLGAKEETLRHQAAVLEKAVPAILKPNTFIRRINEVAALHSVVVQSVTPGSASAYTPPASAAGSPAAAPATPVTTGTGSSAATPAPVPTESVAPVAAAPAAATPAAPALALTSSLVTPANFVVVPVTITVSGTRDAILGFVSAMQDDERVFVVNGISTSAGDAGADTGTLSGFIYTLKR